MRAVVGECRATACETDIRLGVNHAEDCEGAQNLLVLQNLALAERRALDRHQDIDRNRLDAELGEGQRHVDAVLPGLAHADDAAGADAEALFLGGANGLELLVKGVGRANFGEEAARGLNVVVIARDAREVQLVQLLSRQKAVGGAEINLALLGHAAVSGERVLELFAGQRAPRSHNREAVHALALVRLTGSDNHILRQKRILFATGLRVCGLRAVLAVLAAAAASAVDNRT